MEMIENKKTAEKELFKVFEGKRNRSRIDKYVFEKLKTNGVKLKYAKCIARFTQANGKLLKIEGWLINKEMDKIIEDYKKKNLTEKIALKFPNRLKKHGQFSLPVNSQTISFRTEKLLYNREVLNKNQIPVTSTTLVRNPHTLVQIKGHLEEKGIKPSLKLITLAGQLTKS